MEYVDGEDLSALLKRIGRFPEDRALEVARQICAGLGAAHERGVVHRDFKPANVMLDGDGRVRITDFGLAGMSGESLRAGTPAYMAPEQLAGQEVTARSDIYALGLVLYEVFTGRRALEGANLAELIHRREQSGITPPSQVVRDLDDQVDHAIMRCLRPSPAERPPSAIAVAAALPGGDPLAAALAAGETPSPEMVAAAGITEAVSARTALAGAAWVVLALALVAVMYERVMLVNRLAPPKSPAALQDRAEEALRALGYGDGPVGRASGLGVSGDFPRYVERTSQAADRWSALRSGSPATFYLWHRTSPRPLLPWGDENPIRGTNPPMTTAGMALIVVDGAGRLAEFGAVPEPLQADHVRKPTDWNVLFSAAGLDPATFRPVDPQWLPAVFADERRAWEGTIPEQPGQTVRIEAAAMAGRPVSFLVTGPWSRSARASQPLPQSLFSRVLGWIGEFVMPGLMIAAALLAWGNIKGGRGDRRGATRAAAVYILLGIAGWALATQHVGVIAEDIDRLFSALGRTMFDGALLFVSYMAIEPYIRRFSPGSLIGWTRLLAGRWRDPQVATDVLLGVCAGLGMTLLYAVHNLIPPLFGRPEPMPLEPADADVLLGVRFMLGHMLRQLVQAVAAGTLAVAGVVAILLLVKRKWLAHLVSSLIFVWVVISGMFPPGTPLLDIGIGLGIIAIWTGVILHGGLLATVAALSTHFVLLRVPITTDLSNWRGSLTVTYLLVIGGIGLAAAYWARYATVQTGTERTS